MSPAPKGGSGKGRKSRKSTPSPEATALEASGPSPEAPEEAAPEAGPAPEARPEPEPEPAAPAAPEPPPPAAEEAPPAGDPEWTVPLPEILPRPTYSPGILAMGMTLVAFGIITSPILCGVGFLLILVGGAEWIGELRHERRQYEELRARQSGPQP